MMSIGVKRVLCSGLQHDFQEGTILFGRVEGIAWLKPEHRAFWLQIHLFARKWRWHCRPGRRKSMVSVVFVVCRQRCRFAIQFCSVSILIHHCFALFWFASTGVATRSPSTRCSFWHSLLDSIPSLLVPNFFPEDPWFLRDHASVLSFATLSRQSSPRLACAGLLCSLW